MSIGFATLAVGSKGRELLDVSGPLLREWAKSLGASFHVIDQAPADYALAGKFHLSRIVARHDRTLFVDADVIPDLAAMPDILATVPEAAVGMHDDLPLLRSPTWAEGLFRRLAESQGWSWSGPLARVWNTGVIVASRRHAELFTPPRRSFPAEHCSEQFLIQLAIERAGVPVHALDKRLNWQWWPRRRMPGRRERPDIAVRHFAGTSQPAAFQTTHRDRLRMMRAAVAELRGEAASEREGRRCRLLGRRIEHRAGCRSGWACRHECGSDREDVRIHLGGVAQAVPGEDCRDCPGFEDGGRF